MNMKNKLGIAERKEQYLIQEFSFYGKRDLVDDIIAIATFIPK